MPDQTKTKQEISLAPQGGPLAHADDAFCRTRSHFHLPAVAATPRQTGQFYLGASASFTAAVIPEVIGDYLHAPPQALDRARQEAIRIGGLAAATLEVTILPAAPGEANTGTLHAGEKSLSLTLHAEPAALDELIRYLRADRCPRLAVAASFTVPGFSGGLAPHSGTPVRLLHLRSCCPKGITPLRKGDAS